jgi:hypothetical protein
LRPNSSAIAEVRGKRYRTRTVTVDFYPKVMPTLTLDTVHHLHTPNANNCVTAILYHLERYRETRDYAHLEIAQQSAQSAQRSLSAIATYLNHS